MSSIQPFTLSNMKTFESIYSDDILTAYPLPNSGQNIDRQAISHFTTLLISQFISLQTKEKDTLIDTTSYKGLSTSKSSTSFIAESTDAKDVNAQNQAYLDFLNKRSSAFVISLKNTDFEDGMTNDISTEIEHYLSENAFATYMWLHSLYSQYQADYEVISGLLRVISLVVKTSDSNYLLPIVKCGLSDQHTSAQEAAIMVIEKWRTKECLDSLRTTTFTSDWLRRYADSVIKELEEELQNVA